MEDQRVIVRIVAQDKRYTKMHYRSVPTWKENWSTYLTGQHINPEEKSTLGNLSVEQMLGKQPLTKEQREKFGYVINPEDGLLIKHNSRYDITLDENGNPLNHKDYWEVEYMKYQSVVALSKMEFNVDVHRFYIENKIAEAKKSISKREKVYKAVEMFRSNLTMEKMYDISLMLNYYVPTFRVDPKKISKVVLEEMIYEQCEKNPDDVLKCFGPNSQMETYILKMCDVGILRRMGNDFFYGDTFVGQGLEKVQAFMTKEDNRATVNKWASLMKGDQFISGGDKAGKAESEILNIFAEGLSAIISGDASKIAYVKKRLVELNATAYLEKLQEAATKAESDSSNRKDRNINEDNTSNDTNYSEDNAVPSLLTLKQQAGRLGIEKDVYQNMNQEELFRYIENYKSQNKKQ